MSYDILVVGGGPAGLTAAIQARVRDKTVLVVTNEPTASPLCKAREMDNYPGMPHVSGLALVETMEISAQVTIPCLSIKSYI